MAYFKPIESDRTLKKTTMISLSGLVGLSLLASCDGSGIDLSGLSVQLPGQDVTANWKSPANYARAPIGQNPVNPITLSVDFSDHTGCPTKTYRFWLFSRDGGTPLAGIGSNAELAYDNHFEQIISLPVDVPVYQIRLACTKANGDRYANSDILESGSPAFTPRHAVSWQNPEGYSRLPTGTNTINPITLSVDFSDESGCPYQLYRFWSYSLNGTPVGPIGDTMVLTPGSGVTTTATLPANVPINAVRLACVDNDGNRYDNTANLEIGNPAFTPASSGTCSGHDAAFCAAPAISSVCTTCGGSWITTPASCVGNASPDAEPQCQTRTTQSACDSVGLVNTATGQPLHPTSLCTWTDSCHAKTTICTDQPSEYLCNYSVANGFGVCTWITAEDICMNPTTTLCTSPQTETTCAACGGTWAQTP